MADPYASLGCVYTTFSNYSPLLAWLSLVGHRTFIMNMHIKMARTYLYVEDPQLPYWTTCQI
jgi:hypothetical protein